MIPLSHTDKESAKQESSKTATVVSLAPFSGLKAAVFMEMMKDGWKNQFAYLSIMHSGPNIMSLDVYSNKLKSKFITVA
jgi:hypothetical protein